MERNKMVYKTDIKLMAFVISAMFWGSGYAADNSIYIEQTGDNGTYTVKQDGSGNKVKGIGQTVGTAGPDATTAKFVGNAQTVNIEQTGMGNVLSIGANTTQGGSLANYSNIGVNINYQVTGGGNTGIIDVNNNSRGSSMGSRINITQDGNATAKLKMTGSENLFNANTAGGNGNIVDATVDASNTTVNLNQTGGGGNETTINLTGDKGTVTVTTVGASNITSIVQSASNTIGSTILIDITGTGNSTTVNQSGVADHYAKLQLDAGSDNNIISVTQSGIYNHSTDLRLRAGSDLNTITVTQSGGGANGGQVALLDVSGSTNTIGVTQQGAVANYLNMKVTGSTNTYTVIQKN